MSKIGRKRKEKPSREVWSKLDNRLADIEDLIHKKQGNLKQLEEEYAASQDEQEKKYIGTSIKAAKLDLDDEIKFFEGLMEDSAATKAAVEGEFESSVSEEEKEEDEEDLHLEDEEEVPRGPKTKKPGEENLTKEEFDKKLKAEFDKRLKAEVEKKLKEEKTDAAVIATNSKVDRLITAISEGRGTGYGGDSRDREGPAGGDRKRTLGQTPSFVTGQSDFITHIESFKDFTELNDINQDNKIKRLFLTTLDQKARMRCAGLEPGKSPCLEMTADEYIARLQEQFVPRATLLIVQQAFHDLRQKPSELATDYLLAKWGHFRRGWNRPNAPFSFYYESATIGLYDETLRNEVFREVISCPDSNDRAEMNAAFQRYLERVQQVLAYVRRTSSISNPDGRGLGITGQPTKAPGKPAFSNSEVEVLEQMQMYQEEEEEWYDAEDEEEVGELDEQQIAFAEALEDPRFTELVEQDFHTVGEAEGKLCFICKSPRHLARQCQMRMRNLSSAMGRMGFRPRAPQRGWRGGARGSGRGWRGSRGSGRGPARGRPAPLSGFPTHLPAPGQTLRPITSAQAGHARSQDF